MSTAHTPGPWTCDVVIDGRSDFASPNIQPQYCINRRGWGIDSIPRDEAAANARLIAAVPELLACLRRMCGMYGAYSGKLAPLLAEDEGTVWTFERANGLALEAIAKAEGR